MATSEQAAMGQYGVLKFDRGDLIEYFGSGRKTRLRLVECPLCAADPERPRHHFESTQRRPQHFREAHGPEDV